MFTENIPDNKGDSVKHSEDQSKTEGRVIPTKL